MAGTNRDFDALAFREGITFAQTMGMPPDEEEQATFHFPSQLVYNTPTDEQGVPFDPNATVTRVVPPPVRVPCAITYFDREGEITGFGVVTPTRITIDLLDEHYDRVRGFAFVVVGGDKYVYRRTEPPGGLFDVGIYTIHCDAENET